MTSAVVFYPSGSTAYDVTDVKTWKDVLEANVTAGNRLVPVQFGNKIVFIEVSSS
jgi:hypothetical protein